jgi:thimet oligopeptidase
VKPRFLAAPLVAVLVFPGFCAASVPVVEPFPTDAAPPPFVFTLGAATIHANCTAAIARARGKVAAILHGHGPHTFSTVVKPLEDAFADLNDQTMVEILESAVSSDAKARDASFTCQNDEAALQNAVDADPKLYAAVNDASKSATAKTLADRKLTSLWLVAIKRSGAGLPAAKRVQVVTLQNQIAALETRFNANLANDATTIHITAAQAAGLADDFVAGLKKSGDGYDVPVNESTSRRFMQNASDAAARKAYFLAYNNRATPTNVALLETTIGVRDRLAHLLGYASWAAYQLADKMAASPKRVEDFLDALDVKLLPRAKADVATLAALKAKDLGTPTATIDAWDVAYYDNQLNKTKYAVDEQAILQYFPVSHVELAVFGIYSKLLGVTFTKRDVANVWNPDVTEWAVHDSATGRYIGDFYLDLFPRPGKYEHFASFPLLPYRVLADGRARPPLDAIIGNWPMPAPGKPAVLSHDDVETFFHEFGHDMATMLATAPYETLSAGFRSDFVEAPSQMLENWVWDPQILKELSSNVTTGEPLSDDTIAKMRAARYVDHAYYTTQQIVYATVDMKFHSSGPHVDTTALWREVADKEIPTGLAPGTHPQAGFGHLMGGYDAGYYGYLWSKVYAQDMFTAFEAAGLESPVVGARYRRDILEPARELEPDAEVKAFLGRPMDPTAFYKEFNEEATTAQTPPSATTNPKP